MFDVSVVIPLYKGNKYLDRLVNMLMNNINNTTASVQVIFVNDYPDDRINIGAVSKIDNSIVIENEENMGIHASRVIGIKKSSGKYIMMLDQDDLITDNWIDSQFKCVIEKRIDICVCNGWRRRFAVLWEEKIICNSIDDLNCYLEKGCQIDSPGQVIIKKDSLPKEWFENIICKNGADDYFLWILSIKKGLKMGLNNNMLYFHTPDRQKDSISSDNMNESRNEVLEKMRSTNKFSEYELCLLEKRIREKKGSIPEKKAIEMFYILYSWRKLSNQGKSINSYLCNCGYERIAIYGLGYIGECLCEEIENNNNIIFFGIDKNANDFEQKIKIYRIEEELPDVDLVIITIACEKESIKRNICKKVNCDVCTMNELLLACRDDVKL